MLNQFSRTQLLFGPEAMERLWKSRVAVFGIGGRINFGDAVITFLQRKLLIKAVGDAARHPPFIRSSNRVLILGWKLTDFEGARETSSGFSIGCFP